MTGMISAVSRKRTQGLHMLASILGGLQLREQNTLQKINLAYVEIAARAH